MTRAKNQINYSKDFVDSMITEWGHYKKSTSELNQQAKISSFCRVRNINESTLKGWIRKHQKNVATTNKKTIDLWALNEVREKKI
jgi:hypothetical protein